MTISKTQYILLIIASSLCGILLVNKAFEYYDESKLKNDFKEPLLAECMRTGGGYQYCNCVGDDLVTNYNSRDLALMSTAYIASGVMPIEMKTAIVKCGGEIQ